MRLSGYDVPPGRLSSAVGMWALSRLASIEERHAPEAQSRANS